MSARQQPPQPVRSQPEQPLGHAHLAHGGFEHGDRLLRMRRVCEVVDLSESVVRELLAAREFPQPVRIGKSAVRWSAFEIQSWIEQQLNRRAS